MKTVAKVAAGLAMVAMISTGVGVALGGAGMALMIGGTAIAASTIASVASAIAVGASLLSSKPKAPRGLQANIDRLRANVDPRTPRKTVFGVTAMQAAIR